MPSRSTKTPLRICLLGSALLIAFSTIAHAQSPAPEMTLKISPADLEVISRALDALPFNEAMGTMIRIQAQIDEARGREWDKYRSATTVQDLHIAGGRARP